jgi:ribosomal protein S18 acetylase RimI-like enzyme
LLYQDSRIMQITIVQAQPPELEIVLDILEEAAHWLTSRGIEQWSPGTFRNGRRRRELLAYHLSQGEVYLAKVDGEVNGEAIGTLTLQWSDKLIWGDMPDNAGYVHNLAVRRTFAGMGVGRQLLQWAEKAVVANGKQYLRLDCMAKNAALNRYYQQAGFTCCRHVEGNGWKASLYEKQVI